MVKGRRRPNSRGYCTQLGVGYEIAKAEEWGKPILLLYKERPERKPSAMLNGNKNLKMVKYNDDQEALKEIDNFMKFLE